MIGKAQGPPISITGLGAYAPERVLTNDELSTLVDTSDEWIMERTGIRERRIAAPEQALTDLALPAAKAALAQAGVEARDIDLAALRDGDAGHDVPDLERTPRRHARRGQGRGLRPARRLHGLHVRARAGVRDDRRRARGTRARRRRRRAVADPRLDRPLDAHAVRRRRRRRRSRARSSGPASSASSSARTGAAAFTSRCPGAARARSRRRRATATFT